MRQIVPNQHLSPLPQEKYYIYIKIFLKFILDIYLFIYILYVSDYEVTKEKKLPLVSSQHHNIQSQQKEKNEATIALKIPSHTVSNWREFFSPSESCCILWFVNFPFHWKREAGAIITLCSSSQTCSSKTASLPSYGFHPDWHTLWSSCQHLPSTSALTHSQWPSHWAMSGWRKWSPSGLRHPSQHVQFLD